tara:strand:- start:738 stop:1220 length:483 start_codon:yes stop_codon:yes gene_type:complete
MLFTDIKLKKKKLILIFVILLSSCSSNADNRKLGQILGSSIGAIVGSEFGSGSSKSIMTVIGAAAGYLIGGEIVDILSKDEQDELNNEILDSLENSPAHSKNAWQSKIDPSTKAEIIPGEEFTYDKSKCRKYKKTIIKNDEKYLSEGTACRNNDGDWVLL